MSRKGVTITLSLLPGEREQLEKVAAAHSCTWGEQPNISKLLRAIAQGELLVVNPDEALKLSERKMQQVRWAIATLQRYLLNEE